MTELSLRRETGAAILWKGAQLAGTKLVFFVRLFILARLLSPADFGLMAVAMVAVDVLMSVTNLGMIPAVVQRAEIEPRHYHAAWTVGLARSGAITAVVFLGAPVIARIVGEPQVVDLVRALAFLPTLDALASIRLAEFMRRLAFKELALVDLAKAIGNAAISIALARPLGVWALVAGSLAGSLFFTAASFILAPYKPRLVFDWSAVRPLIKFGRWIFVTSLVSVSGSAVLRVILTREVGPAALGLYFLAAKLAFLPAEVASEVIGAVAFPVYSRLQSNLAEATSFLKSNVVALSALLLPVFVLIAVLASPLVDHVLGQQWVGTEVIIQLLAVIGILGLMGDVVVPAFKGLGQPVRFAFVEGAQSVLLVASLVLFAPRFGLLAAPLAWFPAIIGSQAFAILYLRKLLRNPLSGLLKPMLALAVAGAASGSAAAAIYWAIPTFLGFILAGFAAVLFNIIAVWLADARFHLDIGESLSTLFPQVMTAIHRFPRKTRFDNSRARASWVGRQVVRPVRRTVAATLYRDNNPELDANIIVAGTARSGTTWLGSIVAGEEGRVLFEPFNPRKMSALRELPYFPYLRPDDEAPALATYCHQLFRGEVRHRWIDRETSRLRPAFRVTKAIRANLMLKWLRQQFPQIPVLLVMRHPCAVVLSRMRLNWATDDDIQPFLSQPKLVEDHLAPYLPTIERARSQAEKHAVIWCVSNLVPLRQFRSEELNLFFYEDLCTDPQHELARIERVTGRPLPASAQSALDRPSVTALAESAVTQRRNRVNAWQAGLSPSDVRQVLDVVGAFGLDFLYDHDPLPKSRPGRAGESG